VRPVALLLLLLFAAAAVAGDAFEPERKELPGLDDAAYARWMESLALAKAALAEDPADVVALERAVLLLAPFNIADRLEKKVAAALLATATEGGPRRAALLSLAGHLQVLKVQMSEGRGWVIVGGRPQPVEDEKTRFLLTGAADMLREAIRARPLDRRARRDLAWVLQKLDETANEQEIERLHLEANALELREFERPALPRLDLEAQKLRHRAEELEQQGPEPDHANALLLRKQALVLDFCTGTMPFVYDAALYGAVSLLADEDLIHRNLTRTYRKLDDTIDTVPPKYHAPKLQQRVKIVEGLGRDPGAGAGAALVKLVLAARQRDPVAEASVAALVAGRHEAVREHMPELLAANVGGAFDDLRCPPVAQQLLVEAAVGLDVRAAAPVLAKLLPLDTDLRLPRGVARALAALGGPEQVEALLALARDPSHDVYFRREAILALGRLQPERLDDVPAEPYLELALAAARYRVAPSEALLGRLLQGLGRPHEADDAARYCADLDVREAIPELERFISGQKDHYAAALVREAYDRLRSGARD